MMASETPSHRDLSKVESLELPKTANLTRIPNSHSNWPGVWRWECRQDLNFSSMKLQIVCIQLSAKPWITLGKDCVKIRPVSPFVWFVMSHFFLWQHALRQAFSCCPSGQVFVFLSLDLVRRHIVQTGSFRTLILKATVSRLLVKHLCWIISIKVTRLMWFFFLESNHLWFKNPLALK